MEIGIKRVYEPYSKEDGFRLLVDRLWPRGIKKENAHIDQWLKEISPSTALRKWFNHEADKWEGFRSRYHAELHASPVLGELFALVKEHKKLTFIFASREEERNHAIVLRQFVTAQLKA